MKKKQLFKLGAGAGLATMVLGALMVLAPGAGAVAGPQIETGPSGQNAAAECLVGFEKLGIAVPDSYSGVKWDGNPDYTDKAATSSFNGMLGTASATKGTGKVTVTYTVNLPAEFAVVKQSNDIKVAIDLDGLLTGSFDFTQDDDLSHFTLCSYVPVVDVCPNQPGNQPTGTVCDPPPVVDVCPNQPGNQPTGTVCDPPPFDQCPDIQGNQPAGTNCTPPPPPPPGTFDACPSIPGDQVFGTDCSPPPPVVTDVCDELDGVQVEVDDCLVEVLPTPPLEPTDPEPTPEPEPEPEEVKPSVTERPAVLGVQTVRALPRTGDETGNLAGAGALMLALGAALVLASKRQLAQR